MSYLMDADSLHSGTRAVSQQLLGSGELLIEPGARAGPTDLRGTSIHDEEYPKSTHLHRPDRGDNPGHRGELRNFVSRTRRQRLDRHASDCSLVDRAHVRR